MPGGTTATSDGAGTEMRFWGLPVRAAFPGIWTRWGSVGLFLPPLLGRAGPVSVGDPGRRVHLEGAGGLLLG